MQDQPGLDAEFPFLQSDAETFGYDIHAEYYTDMNVGLNLFFKKARLLLLFQEETRHIRIKRRTLMSRYGYKRMSAALLEHLNTCLHFYKLQLFLRGGVPCQMKDTEIHDVLIFRLLHN